MAFETPGITNSNDPPQTGAPASVEAGKAYRSWAIWALRFTAAVALGASVILLWVAWSSGGAVPGCGEVLGCEHVLDSRWSKVWGWPVSAPAIGLWLAVLVLAFLVGRKTSCGQRLIWSLLLWLTAMAAAAAVWFIVLQVLVLGQICPYCMVAHLCGLAALGLVLAQAPIAWRGHQASNFSNLTLTQALTLLLVGMAGIVLFPLGAGEDKLKARVSSGETASQTSPQNLPIDPTQRTVVVAAPNLQVGLKPAQYPLLGPLTAEHVVVSLTDYTCPHCRILHGYLREARARFGDQLAIVEMFAPLDSACNPRITQTEPAHQDACLLAKLGAAVWRESPKDFETFDDWMFAGESARSVEEARRKAIEIIGQDALDLALANPQTLELVQRGINLYLQLVQRSTGSGALPKLLAGSMLVEGRPGSADDLFKLLEEALNIQPQTRATHSTTQSASAIRPAP